MDTMQGWSRTVVSFIVLLRHGLRGPRGNLRTRGPGGYKTSLFFSSLFSSFFPFLPFCTRSGVSFRPASLKVHKSTETQKKAEKAGVCTCSGAQVPTVGSAGSPVAAERHLDSLKYGKGSKGSVMGITGRGRPSPPYTHGFSHDDGLPQFVVNFECAPAQLK